MANQPLVSVIMCTYNGAIHLAAQIKSIIAQSYTNLEIIIVDDQSTDGTIEIIQQFAKTDARIKHFRNTENLGFNKNFERALGFTTADYIAFSDQDDIWLPDKIEALVKAIGDNWLVFSNSTLINENDLPLGKNLLNHLNVTDAGFRNLLLFNFVTGHTCLISKAFIPLILPIPAEGYYDWWMGFIALYHNKITYCDKVLTRYRVHSQSVIQTVINNKQESFELLDFKSSLKMLANFENYKSLTTPDRQFITNVKKILEHRLRQPYHLPLIWLVFKNYKTLFKNLGRKRKFARFVFAFKYSGKLK